MRILLVEDDLALGEGIRTALKPEGYTVDWLQDGVSALHALSHESFELVILDLGLPRMDGLQLLKQLRGAANPLPVLVLTARDATADRIAGLDAGADDYLTKPFAEAELLARCQALSVRHRAGTRHRLQIGSLCIDRRLGIATRQEQAMNLHQTPFRILLELAEAWPGTLTRSQLIARLWGDAAPDSDPLRTHLYLLRQALDKPFATPMLETVHGVGFRLVADQ